MKYFAFFSFAFGLYLWANDTINQDQIEINVTINSVQKNLLNDLKTLNDDFSSNDYLNEEFSIEKVIRNNRMLTLLEVSYERNKKSQLILFKNDSTNKLQAKVISEQKDLLNILRTLKNKFQLKLCSSSFDSKNKEISLEETARNNRMLTLLEASYERSNRLLDLMNILALKNSFQVSESTPLKETQILHDEETPFETLNELKKPKKNKKRNFNIKKIPSIKEANTICCKKCFDKHQRYVFGIPDDLQAKNSKFDTRWSIIDHLLTKHIKNNYCSFCTLSLDQQSSKEHAKNHIDEMRYNEVHDYIYPNYCNRKIV